MKKSVILTQVAFALGTIYISPAQAAFTSMTDGSYRMVITGGCFDVGSPDDCTAGSGYHLLDNTTQNQADASAFGYPYGSGITNDGLMGVIEFSLRGGNISVTSFSQDSYLYTYGGTIYLRSIDNTTMSGSIDNSGNMTFDPTGRVAFKSLLPDLGENAWNRDDSTNAPGGTGLYDIWTSGTSSNRQQGNSPGFTLTGSPLQDAGSGIWTGTLVSAGNMGQAWDSSFDGLQYSEIFNIQISAVPVPAVAWLFGSGLLGLVGAGYSRNKQS